MIVQADVHRPAGEHDEGMKSKSRLTGPTSPPPVEIQPKQYLLQAFAWLLAGVLKELQQSEVVLPDSR